MIVVSLEVHSLLIGRMFCRALESGQCNRLRSCEAEHSFSA